MALSPAGAVDQRRDHSGPGGADHRAGFLQMGRRFGSVLRRRGKFSGARQRPGVLGSAPEQHHLDRALPHHPDRDGAAGGLDAPHRPARPDLFPGRLLPAGHHCDGNHRPHLAGHDLQPGVRRLRLAQAVRRRHRRPPRPAVDGVVRRRDGRPVALVGLSRRDLLRSTPRRSRPSISKPPASRARAFGRCCGWCSSPPSGRPSR